MTTSPADNWEITFILPADAMPFYEKALDGDNVALLGSEIEKGPDTGKWILSAIYEQKPDMASLNASLAVASTVSGCPVPEAEITVIPPKNWLKESLISFKPVEAGRYYIYGSHIKEAPPKGKIALCIDAATAFGSGEHFTTKGCLTAMDEISRSHSPRNVLDMGCGSGILGLAAAHTFHCPVYATDIDEEAVRVTRQNAENNGVAQYMTVWQGNGYQPALVRKYAPYDLVFSNILARPLTLMAKDLAKNLAEDGLAVLSGLLEEQENWVLSAHSDVGLNLKKRYRLEGWSTLVVGR